MSEAQVATTRYAKLYHLVSIGVGAVISGDFFGWQEGLVGGFGGLCISLAIVTVLYFLLTFCIAELAAKYPRAGGPYAFATELLGPKLGFIAGLAETLNVLVTTAVIAVGIASYVIQIIDGNPNYAPLYWLLFYLIFLLLNILGIKLSFNLEVVVTGLSLLVLIVFYTSAAFKVNYTKYVLGSCDANEPCEELRWVFPLGTYGIFKGLSFALWFYLGIEELPLVTEETVNPAVNIPRGIIASMIILIIISYATLFFNSSISPGAKAIRMSSAPLLEGFKTAYDNAEFLKYTSWMITIGLIASFHSFIFVSGRLIWAIARDGLFPSFFSYVSKRFKTPMVALATGSILSYSTTLILYYAINNDSVLGAVMINLALTGALISYTLQCLSYLSLRYGDEKYSTYKSPFGSPGAIICIILCVLAFACIVLEGVKDTNFLYSLLGCGLYFAIGMIYYFFATIFSKENKVEVDST